MFTITSMYAGLLGMLYVALSAGVITQRRSKKISFGDGGDCVIAARIRAHGNFSEYVPLGLVLLALTEAQGAPAVAIHLLGLCLLGGRLLHARALTAPKINTNLRILGMVLTFLALICASAGLLLHAVF